MFFASHSALSARVRVSVSAAPGIQVVCPIEHVWPAGTLHHAIENVRGLLGCDVGQRDDELLGAPAGEDILGA